MRDAVIVGAGVFGVWTAHHLQASGWRVTLVDAYGPGNSRSSSGGESRILRCGYGSDAIYSRMARRSLEMWRAAARQLNEPIWHPCGVLWLAPPHDPYVADTRRTLESEGHPVVVLEADGLGARFPQLSPDGIDTALLEPDCGVLMARRAVAALAADLARRGVRLVRGRVVPPGGSGRLRAVHLEGGSEIPGDRFVVACGAWLPGVFPEALAGRIQPSRQVVAWFGVPPGDDRFGPDRLPAWVDFSAGVYGVPDLDSRGVKVGLDAHGPAIDPDGDDRLADAASIAHARAWLARRLPALADAPVLETRVCQYENTSNGDFLIDRHPAYENVWLVGGGSGHGFKHGPAVGAEAARLVASGAPAGEPRFAYQAKGTERRRAVY